MSGAPRFSRAFVLLSLAMAISGALLAWPRFYRAWQLQSVEPEVLDVYRLPAGEGQVELAVVFDYPVPGELLGQPDVDYHVLGVDRCDHLGRMLPPLVVSDAEAPGLVERIRAHGHHWHAYYDRSAPFSSGRIHLLANGDLIDVTEFWGICLLLTPLIVWLLLLVLHLRARDANPRPRRAL